MAKERIGKIQRWILIYSYKKTVKRQLPDDWKLPYRIQSDQFDEPFWKHLYKSEVMLNYFEIEPSRHAVARWVWNYRDTPVKVDPMAEYFDGMRPSRRSREHEYRREAKRKKATVSYVRTKATMVNKGLIKVEPGLGPNTDRITLTRAGKMKAKELIERDDRQ